MLPPINDFTDAIDAFVVCTARASTIFFCRKATFCGLKQCSSNDESCSTWSQDALTRVKPVIATQAQQRAFSLHAVKH